MTLGCNDPWMSVPAKNEQTDRCMRCAWCNRVINKHGEAVSGCHASPIACRACGDSPCDGESCYDAD